MRVLKIKTTSGIQTYLFSTGTSLYINYLIICILVLFNIYTATTLFSIIAIELLLLFFILVKNKKWTVSFNFFEGRPIISSILLLTIMFFISFIPINALTGFYFTDVIYSWSRWTKIWSLNQFPIDSHHYPQLFPTNLSISYVLAGRTDLDMVLKTLMPLFPVNILFIFYDLGRRKENISEYLGGIFYGLIALVFYGVLFITDGNADILVSYLGFLAFYTILQIKDQKNDFKLFILLAIFASAAVNTKMAGLFILGLVYSWIAYYLWQNRKILKLREITKIFLASSFIFLLSLFWYFIKPKEMVEGLNQSPFLLSDIWSRIINASEMLFYSFGPILSIILVISLILSIKIKLPRIIILVGILPVLLIWSILYSYDFRNMSIVVPLIAYGSGYGFYLAFNFFSRTTIRKEKKIKTRTILYIVPISAVLIYLFASSSYFIKTGMLISIMLNKLYFFGYRMVYTTELGYYKYVEYYSGALQVWSILILILYLLYYFRTKKVYVLAVLIVCFVPLSLYFTESKLIQKQASYQSEVDAHNLYYSLFHKLNSQTEKILYTNYKEFAELIPLGNTRFLYSDNALDILKEETSNNLYLFKAKELNNDELSFLNEQEKINNLVLRFDNGDLLLYEKLNH